MKKVLIIMCILLMVSIAHADELYIELSVETGLSPTNDAKHLYSIGPHIVYKPDFLEGLLIYTGVELRGVSIRDSDTANLCRGFDGFGPGNCSWWETVKYDWDNREDEFYFPIGVRYRFWTF